MHLFTLYEIEFALIVLTIMHETVDQYINMSTVCHDLIYLNVKTIMQGSIDPGHVWFCTQPVGVAGE